MNRLLVVMFSFVCFYSLVSSSQACTDFRVIAKDGSVIVTRSMEFSLPLNSNLRTSPRGRHFSSVAPDGQPGMSWTGKFGYVFVDALDQDFAIDGMNERGLSFEYLYLPGETQYQAVPAGKDNHALPYLMLGDWILSNFKTIDEVREALQSIYVFKKTIPIAGNFIFPLHAAVYDATGKGLIIEFLEGKMIINNSVGVMTNDPSYGWHIANMHNYLNLSPYNPKPITEHGVTYSANGQGTGMLGLPGDISPPSRFTKTIFMLSVVYPVASATEALNLAQHVINNVDIPLGLSRAIDKGKESSELTQWVVFKDLTHKVFYYRTYHNLSLRSVTFNKINLTANAPRLKMPLEQETSIIDMTKRFLHPKQTRAKSSIVVTKITKTILNQNTITHVTLPEHRKYLFTADDASQIIFNKKQETFTLNAIAEMFKTDQMVQSKRLSKLKPQAHVLAPGQRQYLLSSADSARIIFKAEHEQLADLDVIKKLFYTDRKTIKSQVKTHLTQVKQPNKPFLKKTISKVMEPGFKKYILKSDGMAEEVFALSTGTVLIRM